MNLRVRGFSVNVKKWLLYAAVFALAACGAQDGGKTPQSTTPPQQSSTSVVGPVSLNFFGLILNLGPGWTVEVEPKPGGSFGRLQYNDDTALTCRPDECPSVTVQTTWLSAWFKGGKYIGTGPCGPESTFQLAKFKETVEIGGVPADYYESVSCDGQSVRRTWWVRNMLIIGLPALDGRFPQDFSTALTKSTWK